MALIKPGRDKAHGTASQSEPATQLLREALAHLREKRKELRDVWVERILGARLLSSMTEEEILTSSTSLYDAYVGALETSSLAPLPPQNRGLFEHVIPRIVPTDEVVWLVLLLRDVIARHLLTKYQHDALSLGRILDVYEPAANAIAVTVAVGSIEKREHAMQDQLEALREMTTPVLQVRDRLLIVPLSGVIDPQRANQVTEQLLRAVSTNRARVVVIDITEVTGMDSNVANHLVKTVEASRLMGAAVIVTGVSPEIAQTLVRIGVDLAKMTTVGDLQGGLEQAEEFLGYKVVPLMERPNEVIAR
jgi:rsbT co-antagonist protein RsbR